MARETTNSKRKSLFHSGKRLRATRCASPEVSHNPQTLLSFRSQQNKSTAGTCAPLPPLPAKLTFTGMEFYSDLDHLLGTNAGRPNILGQSSETRVCVHFVFPLGVTQWRVAHESGCAQHIAFAIDAAWTAAGTCTPFPPLPAKLAFTTMEFYSALDHLLGTIADRSNIL